MQLVTVNDGEIRLNSNLSEMAFGKTSYASIISQKGIVAECTSYQEGKYTFDFKDWSFEDVKSFKQDGKDDLVVFYCAKADGFTGKAKSLCDFLLDEDKADAFEAGYVICSILTQAAKEDISLPLNGGGGILIELKKDKTKVLFLPQSLFESAASGLNKSDFAALQGSWINKTLSGLPALSFLRASVAYKMLTGNFAYPNESDLDRYADILDQKFLPLELCINGIDKNLCKEINKALKLNANIVNIPGKKKKGKATEDLTPDKDFPLELLYAQKSAEYKAEVSEEDFRRKVDFYLKNQNSKIKTKRSIRRNTSRIIVYTIAAIAIIAASFSFYYTKQDEYYTKGLTSTQVLQTFLYSVDEKDTVTLSNFVKGHQCQPFVNTVSQIYVLGKQRQTYNHDNGYGTMVNWLFYCSDAESMNKAGLYTICQPKIDDKLISLKNTAFKKNQKVDALKSENGIELKDGQKSVHKVDFLLLHTEGEFNQIECDYQTCTFTLTYKKDRWYITNIDTESESVEFNSIAFKNDYLTSLIKNDGDVIKTCNQLRLTYFWLPSEEALLIEKEKRDLALKDPFGKLAN